jgi:hypothetical protein
MAATRNVDVIQKQAYMEVLPPLPRYIPHLTMNQVVDLEVWTGV